MSLGALLTLLQLAFAITWIVYVIYLPALVAQAGLDTRHVPLILMMDQLVFVACDWAAGIYADRLARHFRRIGTAMSIVTLVSCAAFLGLPWAAPHLGPAAFLALTVLWSATSSALRAPPLVLAAAQTPASRQPWIGAFYLLGLGVAGAVAPYLGLALKQIDPRIPFALASLVLAAFAMGVAHAEQVFPSPPENRRRRAALRPSLILPFALAVLLLALGFQIHFSLNSAPAYLRHAAAEQLPQLLPVFWIGFNLAILPATLLPRWLGGALPMMGGAVAGAAAFFFMDRAANLPQLAAFQLLAGAAWALALTSAFTAALEIGRPTREGFILGALFSALALAALARLGVTAAGLPARSDALLFFREMPFYAWAAGGLLLAVMAWRLAALERE